MEQLTQPFIDLFNAPRALWGINLAYFLEGMVYFGMLGYLAMHFSDFIFQGLPHPDIEAHHMVMFLTAGITISMFFLGTVADKKGIRKTLLMAFVLLLIGRVLISAAPTVLGLQPDGMWSPLHIVTLLGMVLIVIGYGMYQPAAYAGVKKFTSPKNAAMGFAMLYALMNLGGYLPSFAFLLRDNMGLGITGVYWFYTVVTLVALVMTLLILNPKVEKEAEDQANAEREAMAKEEAAKKKEAGETVEEKVVEKTESNDGFFDKMRNYFLNHPLRDLKFTFFITALIPVQTLFTYNWLILPQYINRAYDGFIGEKFELASNFNPLLIFIFVPVVTALTQKKNIYSMMIIGTFTMAAPAFFLALGTNIWTLGAYLIVMTVGEALWQPRFLQYAAEIAPEGRTGEYMGVAQLPWFLTKMLVPLYSGFMIDKYVPAEGAKDPEGMWLIFGVIAILSSIFLVMGRKWVGNMKVKA
ncbi:MAG: MFS transporter [bacterium]|nr:MFS transporter [bacterium]